MKKYYFTQRYWPTEEETKEAESIGATLLNGLNADKFKRPGSYYGNVPPHLKPTVKKAIRKKSPEIKSQAKD